MKGKITARPKELGDPNSPGPNQIKCTSGSRVIVSPTRKSSPEQKTPTRSTSRPKAKLSQVFGFPSPRFLQYTAQSLNPQSQSLSRSYGSNMPTSLTYIVLSTRGCSPWRPDAVMSTTMSVNKISPPDFQELPRAHQTLQDVKCSTDRCYPISRLSDSRISRGR